MVLGLAQQFAYVSDLALSPAPSTSSLNPHIGTCAPDRARPDPMQHAHSERAPLSLERARDLRWQVVAVKQTPGPFKSLAPFERRSGT